MAEALPGIQEPPSGLIGRLRFLGPGFILSASVVGSGELIATTLLGAEAGFTAFWVILVSCLVKVAVQMEFGRHAILTGQTPMQGFLRLPGTVKARGKWSIWLLLFLMSIKVIQIGGILGATSLVLNLLFPALPVPVWTVATAVLASLLIFSGGYPRIERLSLLMVSSFTLLTLVALLALQFTEFAFTASEVLSAQQLRFNPAVVAIALGAFGITGVGSDEIIAYNYWCLEKGYSAYAGSCDNSPGWKQRVKGWISVMHLDALVAMMVYTLVTAAFYLLGAAVLHRAGNSPQGAEVIETLSLIYTQSLGRGVMMVYLAGAFFVLFSSVVATLALWTRLFPDIGVQLGWMPETRKKRWMHLLAWVFPACWAIAYYFIEHPVLMVLSGGVVGSIVLLLVAYAAYRFHRTGEKSLKAGAAYSAAFWLSLLVIAGLAVYGLAGVMAGRF